MTNPYSNRDVITDPQSFWGRSQDVSRIYDRINTDPPQCVNIVGKDKTGKSSMLLFLGNSENKKKFLRRPDDCIFALKRCNEWSDPGPEEFLKSLVVEIVRGAEGLITERVEGSYEGLRCLARIITDKKMKLIVFLDDFDVITQNKAYPAEFFSFLRALANNFGIAYVITSQRTLAETCVQGDVRESPFFNIFTSVTLGPVSKDEATELIRRPSRNEGVDLHDQTGFILYIAGCFPFLLQVACSLVFEAKREKGELDEADLRDIRTRFVKEARGFFETIWQQLRQDEMDVCEELARSGDAEGFDQDAIKDLVDKGYVLRDEKGISLFCAGFKYFVRDKCEASDETTSLRMFLETDYKRNGSALARWLAELMPGKATGR